MAVCARWVDRKSGWPFGRWLAFGGAFALHSREACGVKFHKTEMRSHQCCCTQVTCGSSNCPSPCRRCNTSTDTCEVANFDGTCTTSDQKTGRCESGVCKVILRKCEPGLGLEWWVEQTCEASSAPLVHVP